MKLPPIPEQLEAKFGVAAEYKSDNYHENPRVTIYGPGMGGESVGIVLSADQIAYLRPFLRKVDEGLKARRLSGQAKRGQV